MGSVFLAEDTLENNKRIALKTIKSDQEKLPAIERFKNEFKSLTQLHHPNLAEVYDFGTVSYGGSVGQGTSSAKLEYFFTMEYVEGEDFFKATENLSYEQLYGLVVQICRALEYVHRRGVLHNDLKPENILIKTLDKEGYLAKLMDFGLADEKPTPGKIKGTAHYIAPEVALGKSATPLSDLYSLGVVLYQVSTRRLPFVGKDAVEVLKNQIEQDPNPPQRIKADIPEELQTIILKLLSKKPKSRYQSAQEVIEAINNLTQKDFQIDTQETEKSYLLAGKLIGREKEISFFQEQLQRLSKEKKGSFILIRGESGVGKTRLLNELKYQVQLNNLSYFSGKIASEGSSPYQPVKEILKQIYPQSGESTLKKHIWILQKLMPESFPSESRAEQAKLSPEQEKLKLFDEVTQLLLEFCESKPSILGLDDLQLADQASLELLIYISRNIKGYPLSILGTYQEQKRGEETGNTFFENEAQELKAEGLLNEVHLEPFDPQGIEELLKSILGVEAVPSGFIEKLKELTGGNPFFLQEVMKAILERKSFSRKDIYWSLEKFDFSEIKIPSTLRGILSERVKKLEPQLLSLVQTFAVFNRAVETEFLQKAFQKSEDELLSGLDSLQKMEILKAEKENEKEVYSFTNAQIREVIYEQMESESRKRMHQHLGLLLEEFCRPNHRAYSEELAYHFINSYDEKRALSYSLLAGRHSRKLYANNDSVKFLESTLPLLEKRKNHRVASKVYENLLELYQLLGKYDLAIQKFEEWVKICLANRKKAMAFEKIGMIYEKKGEYDLALEHLQKGMQNLGVEEHTFEMARLCYDTGYVHARKGEFEQAKTLYQKALNILKDKKDNTSQKEMGKLLNATGIVHWFQSEYDQATEYYHKSIDIFQKIKDEQELPSPYNNLGNISFALGNYDQAIEYYQKSLWMREKIGDINATAGSYNNLGNAYYKKGNFSEALRNYKRSASIYSRIGARSSLIIPLSNIANISLDQADYRSALEYNQRCLEMAEKVGAVWNASINWHNQGCIYQFLNQLDKAIDCAHKSYALKCKLKDKFGKGGTFNLMGDVYRIKGEWFKSEKYLQRALKINRELNSKPGEAEGLKSWAELNLEAGNYHQAFDLLKKAIKLSEESQDVGLIISSLLLLAKTKLRAKTSNWEEESFSLEEIEKDLKSVLEKAESQQKPEIEWETLADLGTLYRSWQKYTTAIKYYKNSVNILREIYTRVPEEFRNSYLSEPKKIQLRKEISLLREEIKTKNRNSVGVR